MPSSAADSARNPSSTSAASSAQSASRPSRRGSVLPVPGRSGAMMRNPSSRAAWVNRRADSRESASPWQSRTGAPPCSPATSTAITLPSSRRTSIAPWSRLPAGRYQPARPRKRPGPRQRGLASKSWIFPAEPGPHRLTASHHGARRAERGSLDVPPRRNADYALIIHGGADPCGARLVSMLPRLPGIACAGIRPGRGSQRPPGRWPGHRVRAGESRRSRGWPAGGLADPGQRRPEWPVSCQ